MKTKTSRSNLENKKNSFLVMGALIALSVTLISFEWRWFEVDFANLGELSMEDIPEEIIPITKQEQVKPPRPKILINPDIKVVDNNEVVDTTSLVFVEDTIPFTYEPEPKEKEDNTIYISVEKMPTLPGCEKIGNGKKREQCTTQKIYSHLGKVQKYPTMMKEAGVEGTVFVTFVVNKKGKVTDVEILKGVSGGKALDREAKRMIQSLPEFKPGSQQGKNVNIRYNLPIRFALH